MRTRIYTLIAPALLIALVASIAAGVQRYVSPAGGLQLPVPNTGDKALVVHTGGCGIQGKPWTAIDSPYTSRDLRIASFHSLVD